MWLDKIKELDRVPNRREGVAELLGMEAPSISRDTYVYNSSNSHDAYAQR